jgi:hypothetical protein
VIQGREAIDWYFISSNSETSNLRNPGKPVPVAEVVPAQIDVEKQHLVVSK